LNHNALENWGPAFLVLEMDGFINGCLYFWVTEAFMAEIIPNEEKIISLNSHSLSFCKHIKKKKKKKKVYVVQYIFMS
jgi:hypothetical protein